jgi:hypothetical protein
MKLKILVEVNIFFAFSCRCYRAPEWHALLESRKLRFTGQHAAAGISAGVQ